MDNYNSKIDDKILGINAEENSNNNDQKVINNSKYIDSIDDIYLIFSVTDVLVDYANILNRFIEEISKYFKSKLNMALSVEDIIKSINEFINTKYNSININLSSKEYGNHIGWLLAYYGFLCGSLKKKWDNIIFDEMKEIFISVYNNASSIYPDIRQIKNLESTLEVNNKVKIIIWYDPDMGVYNTNNITLIDGYADIIYTSEKTFQDIINNIKMFINTKKIIAFLTPSLTKNIINNYNNDSNINIINVNRGLKYSVTNDQRNNQIQDLNNILDVCLKRI